MKLKTKSILIHASPEKVFSYMDNVANTGMLNDSKKSLEGASI